MDARERLYPQSNRQQKLTLRPVGTPIDLDDHQTVYRNHVHSVAYNDVDGNEDFRLSELELYKDRVAASVPLMDFSRTSKHGVSCTTKCNSLEV